MGTGMLHLLSKDTGKDTGMVMKDGSNSRTVDTIPLLYFHIDRSPSLLPSKDCGT